MPTHFRVENGCPVLTLPGGASIIFKQRPNLEIGSPRERVERIVRHVADIVAGSTFSACIPALIDGAERDRDLRKFHYRFRKQAHQPLINVIAEGVAVGDFPGRRR